MKTFSLLVIEDDHPTIIALPVQDTGTATINGVTYWLVPMAPATGEAESSPDQESEPEQPLSSLVKNRMRENGYDEEHLDSLNTQVLDLHKAGRTVAEITHALGIWGTTVADIIRQSGRETNADRARRLMTQAIVEAGETGASPRILGQLAIREGTRAGPILLNMLRAGTIKRLQTKHWAMP